MASEVTLPALGESVTEGTVTRWLKQVGDTIAVDEPLLEVSTDKVDTEIPSPVSGTLLEQRVDEDDTIEVGAVLAIVGEEGEDTGSGGGSDEAGSEEQEEPAAPERGEQPAEDDSGDDSGDESGEDRSEEDSGGEEEAPQAPAAEQSSGGGGGGGQSVTLPALGESVTEGTVTRWLKQVGDEVAVDEPLLEVSTDKVDTEIPSPVAGTLLEQKVDEDETVEVGAELAVIGSGDGGGSGQEEQAAEPRAEEEPEPEPQAEPEPESESEPEPESESEPEREPQPQAEERKPEAQESSESSESSEGGHGYVTPLVRKLADQHGVDLAAVTGSGVGGRIRKQDVLAAAEEASKAPEPEEPAAAEEPAASAPSVSPSPLRGRTEKMSRLRKVIASRMVESLQTSAQLTTVVEVDVTPIARLRDRVKADFASREGVKLSFMPFFAKASIDALKQHPSLNAAIDTEKGEVTYFDRENIAIAVDTEKGLLTPVVKDAGDLSIAGLARKIADVAERTRANKIGPDELSGGTFTLTNTGSRGALFDTPIINQPQVAILGTGSVVKRPVVIDDPNLGETIAVRHMVYLALTYDHRLVDGADAARFLSEVKERLESGQFEV
jgi:pyruvate dehydrogenase E2 component (dihydrolipoamide acetyltransferase)